MSSILPVQKSELRRELLERRRRLSPDERALAEKRISDVLSAQAVMRGWRRVSVFLPWRGEPDLVSTWRAWHARGIALALPVVVSQARPLVMQSWVPGTALIRDAMGLEVPQSSEVLDCEVWLVPCVGIDVHGARLGAGKGFYDRTIDAIAGPRPMLVGVCYEHATHLPAFAEAHDLRLRACVTESGWRDFDSPGA